MSFSSANKSFKFLTKTFVTFPLLKIIAEDRKKYDGQYFRMIKDVEQRVLIDQSIERMKNEAQWREIW